MAESSSRLDLALVELGLARSRHLAQQLVQQGLVHVDGKPATKVSQQVFSHQQVSVEEHRPWASRAAHKLIGALDELGWNTVPERVLDAGASTGGFTEVLLDRGAQRVYAVDVGHGQLVDELRADPHVTNLEGLNLRDLTLAHLDDEPVDLAVCDVSFISLKLLLEPLFSVLAPPAPGASAAHGKALLMVKPQFEVGRKRLDSRGVVRTQDDRDEAVAGVVDAARHLGWTAVFTAESQLPGPAGNLEYFVAFERA